MNLATALRVLSPCRTLAGADDGTALQNHIVDELESGSVCFVVEENAFYWLNKRSTEAPSIPDVIATARGAGSPGRWLKLGGTLSGLEIIVNNIEPSSLPFELPTSGSFGVPPGLEFTFPPSSISDQFDINIWVEIQNEDTENAHEIEAQIMLDDVSILQTLIITLPANQTILFPLKYVKTLSADNAAPKFSVGFRCDGAGAQIVAGSMDIMKLPA